ncbi:KRAB [Mytilus edulis]|uniref:KRAB n=1 Tax=Mytilus edulis TaxID=6550 RepID=A0A8S3QFN7_MYTED|nr:KRAB [Mytilus edulis]
MKGEQLGPFTCSATCNPPCQYTWTKPDKGIINVGHLIITSLSFEDHGLFICTATNAIGGSQNKSLDVTVNSKFSDRWALTEHEARHSNPLMCNVCGKKYTSRIGLSRYLRDHASSRPIECDICHQRFNDNAHFEGHRNSKHLNYKPFKCTVCSKAFAYRQSMVRHVKECQGNKSYICMECNAVFNSKRSLDQHHSGKHDQKEHTCMCGKSFRWVRSFTRHSKICKTK